MSSKSADKEIRRWLKTPDAATTISNLAKQIYTSLSLYKFPLDFLGIDRSINDSFNDMIKIIESELVLFLLENKSSFQEKMISRPQNKAYYLKWSFMNYCKDKARRRDADPFRYLYKRAAGVLRKSELFYTAAKGKMATAYSMEAENRPVPPLTSEDYGAIFFPANLLKSYDYGSISKESALVELAAHFWRQVSDLWEGEPVLVDIKDFVSWVGLHVPLSQFSAGGDPSVGSELKRYPKGANAQPKASAPGDQIEDISALIPDAGSQPDQIYFDADLIKKWASNFSQLLNAREKAVFYMRYGEQYGFAEIADRLGYEGPSGPKYHLDRFEEKLRNFLCDLPWLSADDLNEKAFSLFNDTLLSLLKKTSL